MFRLRTVLIFGLLLGAVASAIAQTKQDVELKYEAFLEYEYEDSQRAKKQLDQGFELAHKINDVTLIAFGHKYLSWYYDDSYQYDKSLIHIDSSIHYFKLVNNTTELCNAFNLKGNLLSDKALLDSSLIYYSLALELATEIDDKSSMNKVLNNIGIVYTDQGNYLKAMDYFHQAIDLSKSINDQESLGDVYNNIGSLFSTIEDYEQAMEYHNLALVIREKSGDDVRLSSVYLNIGRIHLAKEESELALNFFQKSLTIDIAIEDLGGMAMNYNNIGLAYFYANQLDSSKKYFELALSIRAELDDPFGLVMSYNNLGDYSLKVKRYQAALDYCKKSYDLAKNNGLLYEQSFACNCLSIAFNETGQFEKAYKFLKEFVLLQEQLVSEKSRKELTKNEMQYVFHYQNLEDSLKRAEIQAQKDVLVAYQIKETELEREQAVAAKRSQLVLFTIVGLFLIIIAIILFNSYKKQKRKTELIHEKNEFIKHQKEEIDQSIEYARLIQHTALPSLPLEQIFPSSFLIFLPRDVVSGDFFWLEENEDQAFFAVADCTGHGIPGAFISMIGTILLNEIYNSKNLRAPNEILDELSRLVELTLLSRTGVHMKDGMDISFCSWDKKKNILHYAGANNPVWIVSKNNFLVHDVNGKRVEDLTPNLENGNNYLFEVKADKQPIGKFIDDKKKFNLHSIPLVSGDMVYIFSDGYPDQFGGESGKKFKYKPFKNQFLGISNQPAKQQEIALLKCLKDWKGDHEQIDDICIIGVQIG